MHKINLQACSTHLKSIVAGKSQCFLGKKKHYTQVTLLGTFQSCCHNFLMYMAQILSDQGKIFPAWTVRIFGDTYTHKQYTISFYSSS